MTTSQTDLHTPRFGADEWKLPPAVNLKQTLLLCVAILLLSLSANRTGLYKLPGQFVHGIGEVAGIAPQTGVGQAVRQIYGGFLHLDISDKTDISRVDHFDPKHLPLFTYIRREPIREYSAVEERWKVTETRTFLVDPIGYLKRDLRLMLETIEIAIWGTLLALLLALLPGYFGARGYTPNKYTYQIARGICNITRAVPSMISALFFVMIFGFGVIPGVVSLGIGTMGFLGKFLADDIENADKGPQDALRSLGANKLKVLRYAVLPQVMPQYLAYMQYMLERNVQAATAIGVVGAGGIGMELKGRWDMYDFPHVSTTLVVILATVFTLERLTQRVRTRLIEKV